MRQIRIQSDGTGHDTVVTTESGTELKPYSAVIWLEASEANRVELEFNGPSLDVHADLSETTLTCPICSHKSTHYCKESL